MGFSDASGFLLQLDAHRELVAQEFDTLLGGSQSGQCLAVTAMGHVPPRLPAHRIWRH